MGGVSDQHPRLPGRIPRAGLTDSPHAWSVASTAVRFSTPFLGVRTDAIVDPAGDVHDRVVVEPRGSVAILAIDELGRVLVVKQYRHPAKAKLLEFPAGTLDVEGESRQAAAERELAEEGDIVAEVWEELFTVAASPGYSTERCTLFRATELSPVPEPDRAERQAEEADLVQWWMALDDAVRAVFDGRISHAITVSGILAEAFRSRDGHER